MNNFYRCQEITNNIKVLDSMYNRKEYKSNLGLIKIKELIGINIKENIDLMLDVHTFVLSKILKGKLVLLSKKDLSCIPVNINDKEVDSSLLNTYGISVIDYYLLHKYMISSLSEEIFERLVYEKLMIENVLI